LFHLSVPIDDQLQRHLTLEMGLRFKGVLITPFKDLNLRFELLRKRGFQCPLRSKDLQDFNPVSPLLSRSLVLFLYFFPFLHSP